MRTDDENPYRASALDAGPPEPLEPLPPLPPETPAQRRGKWLIAFGFTVGPYGAALAFAFSVGVAVAILVVGIGMIVAGFAMCRSTPIHVVEED